MSKITIDRAVVEQALEALRAMNPYPASKEDQRASALVALRAALVQQAEPVQEPEGMVEFLADLQRSRTKYPKNRRMFDGLMGEIDELRRAYAGDGDIRAEAFDVAVCAFRIATEGDAGGNARLEQAESDHETRAELAEQQVVQLAEERDHYRNLWQKAQQAEPVEPVAWIDALKDAFFEGFTSVATYNDTLLNSPEEAWENYKPPRAAPPQRRPLTEEEIGRFCDEVYWSPRQLVRAVERAHGIKE